MPGVEETLKKINQYMKARGWKLESVVYGGNELQIDQEVLILVYTRKSCEGMN